MLEAQVVVYENHLGATVRWATVGAGSMGLGPEGTKRLCRSYLRNLYRGFHWRQYVLSLDEIVASVRVEPVMPEGVEGLIADWFTFEAAGRDA